MTRAVKIYFNDGLAQYTASGGETGFTYDFPVYDATHIDVYETSTAGVTTLLTYGTHYTVTGVGVEAGGTIVLDATLYPSGATAAYKYSIYQDAPEERTTDYNLSNNFDSDALNKSLDLLTQQTQQLRRDIGRGVQMPPEDLGTISMVLPKATSRANKIFSFDASGSPTAVSSTDMSGTTVTPTGATVAVSLAERFSRIRHVEDFGATGNGSTDDTAAFVAAATSLAGNGGTIQYGRAGYARKYLFNSADITLPRGVKLQNIGMPPGGSTLYNQAWFDAHTHLLINPSYTLYIDDANHLENLWLHNANITAIPQNNTSAFAGTGIKIYKASGASNVLDIRLDTVFITGFSRAVDATKAPRVIFNNVNFDCQNGLKVNTSGDPDRRMWCHGWPYLTVSGTGTAATLFTRTGAAYEFLGNADAAKIFGCFASNYARGLVVDGANGVSVSMCGFDSPDVSGSIGVEIKNSTGLCQISDSQIVGQQTYGILANLTNSTDLLLLDNVYFQSNAQDVQMTKGSVKIRGGMFNSAASNAIVLSDTSGSASCHISASADGPNMATKNLVFASGSGTVVTIADDNQFINSATIVNNAHHVPSVASASTIDLPRYGGLVNLSGTTTVTTVTGGWAGRTVSLYVESGLTFQHGASLGCPSSANYVAAAGETITLSFFESGKCRIISTW